MNENYSFSFTFSLAERIFAKEIERKFGNPKTTS